MVSTFTMPSFYRTTPLTVDAAHAQQKFFEEDDASILDENILDQSAIDSGLEMSPAMVDSRRESFAVGSSLFSPKQEDWQSVQSVDMQSVPSNNPFLGQTQQQAHHHHHQHHQQNNNPFMRLDHNNFTAAQGSWPPVTASTPASAGSLQAFDGLPTEFDSTASAGLFQRSPIPFSNPTNHVAMFPAVGGQQPSLPNSPHKEHWSGNMSLNKKMRPASPGIRSHNELRKGDGIRKKNARFDIPAERNLGNIDNLIQQSTDEQEIKELKQQKRLLRNRQAALDSRQRKKQHTERLEDEKKVYTAHIGSLEEEVEDLRMTMTQLMNEKQQLSVHIECLTFEKEEMIARHTMETAELRKKIKVLTSHVEALDGATDMSGPSSMTGMHGANHPAQGYGGAPFAEMEGLTMDPTWDGIGFMPEFPNMQQQQQQPQPTPVMAEIKQEKLQPEMQMVVASKKQDAVEIEKPTSQGGLLFMLFLVGALVCSSRSAAPSIPRVSEDVRTASASILESVMKDAGVAESASTAANSFGMPSAPQPSSSSSAAIAWSGSAPAAASAAANTGGSSVLDVMSESLTQPTAEQTKEQLFSLSAAQYNGMTSQDFLDRSSSAAGAGTPGTTPTAAPPPAGRRNLAEALSSMRHGSKAEVYTRSLLWDQIPSDVVRKFVKMVADCSNTNQNADGAEVDA